MSKVFRYGRQECFYFLFFTFFCYHKQYAGADQWGHSIVPNKGFTIVELLIVIVVIGVLAAISIAAFNGIQMRAANTLRIDEVKKGVRLMQSYKALHGEYPPMPTGGYCFGTGFPVGYNNERRCRDYAVSASTSYRESDNSSLINALKTVGNPPAANKVPPTNNHVGPYVSYDHDSSGNLILVQVNTFIQGRPSDCPPDMEQGWSDATLNVAQCRMNLN